MQSNYTLSNHIARIMAKEQAAVMTREEMQSAMKVAIELSESVIHGKGEQFRFNCGYLFMQKIYHQLGLNTICKSISDSNKCSYDLSDILAKLIYTRIIAPSSKLSSFEYSKNFLEQLNFELYQIYRDLDVLAEHSDEIQAEIYKNRPNPIVQMGLFMDANGLP